MRPEADRRVADLLQRQKGVASRQQLLSMGVPSTTVDRRLAGGEWARLLEGIYRVGPVPHPRAWAMAATLAAGPGALLSHGAAAHLWGWCDVAPSGRPDHPIDVIAEGSHRGRRVGIRLHRVGSLAADERAVVDGLPVTSGPRTLVDAAGVLPLRDVEHIVARAQRASAGTAMVRPGAGIDADLLRRAVERYGGRPGVRVLRALLRADGEPALTRSEAEERLLALVRAAGLPSPEVNARLGPYEVDFLFPRHGLVVEVDGYRFHGSRPHFEADRRRDAWIQARGLQVIRLTWRQITLESVRTAVQIGQALARRPDLGDVAR